MCATNRRRSFRITKLGVHKAVWAGTEGDLGTTCATVHRAYYALMWQSLGVVRPDSPLDVRLRLACARPRPHTSPEGPVPVPVWNYRALQPNMVYFSLGPKSILVPELDPVGS